MAESMQGEKMESGQEEKELSGLNEILSLCQSVKQGDINAINQIEQIATDMLAGQEVEMQGETKEQGSFADKLAAAQKGGM